MADEESETEEEMKTKLKTCREPSVQKCLKCTRPDCDAPLRVAPDISEIRALVYAGMTPPQAIANHLHNKGKRFGKAVEKCQT